MSLLMFLLAALGTFHCVNVKHCSKHNLPGCQTLLSHTQLKYIRVVSASHYVTHRFHNNLFLVIKRINLEGAWQASTDTYKAELSFGTLQASEVPPALFPGLSSVSKKLLAYHLHWLLNQSSWLGRITITNVLELTVLYDGTRTAYSILPILGYLTMPLTSAIKDECRRNMSSFF